MERIAADTHHRVRKCEGGESSAVSERVMSYCIDPVRDDDIGDISWATTIPNDVVIFDF